jgi:hypothetical protein
MEDRGLGPVHRAVVDEALEDARGDDATAPQDDGAVSMFKFVVHVLVRFICVENVFEVLVPLAVVLQIR